MLVFHSNTYRDIEFAKKNDIKNFVVILNGASQNEFSNPDKSFRGKLNIPENVPLLLTVGSHTGLKGHRLVLEAFLLAKIGAAVLIIVGNTFGDNRCLIECKICKTLIKILTFGEKKVLLLNPPRYEVVSAFHAADIFVFGSKIECSPIVLFEAMASRTLLLQQLVVMLKKLLIGLVVEF